MSSNEGLGLPAKIPSNKDYENLVDLNYQLFNGLFLTLPLDEIEQTGMLLPLLEARAQKGLSQGEDPAQILEDFFTTHRPIRKRLSENKPNFLFFWISSPNRCPVFTGGRFFPNLLNVELTTSYSRPK